MFTPPTSDPKNAEVLKAIRHIDHVTYVDHLENEKAFCEKWISLGFHEHVRLRCIRYPATHIALVSGSTPEYPWATMTGLSVSEDPASPVNEFVRRYGPGSQHTAYNIDPDSDIEKLHQDMKDLQWNFMTPVLTYNEPSGAKLKQMFIAPTMPFGPFVEFIQRLPGPDGEPFGGFDTMNIDDLYELYDEHSKSLESKK